MGEKWEGPYLCSIYYRFLTFTKRKNILKLITKIEQGVTHPNQWVYLYGEYYWSNILESNHVAITDGRHIFIGGIYPSFHNRHQCRTNLLYSHQIAI